MGKMSDLYTSGAYVTESGGSVLFIHCLRRSDGTPQASLSIPATFFQGGCRKQVLGVCGPIDPPDL